VNAEDVAEAEATGSGSGPNTRVVHPLLEYALNVIVPLGLKPPDRVAVSVADPASTMEPDDETSVAIVGETGETVKGSQPLLAALLLESPVYTASQLYCPATLNV
jgi:hypothetical protein